MPLDTTASRRRHGAVAVLIVSLAFGPVACWGGGPEDDSDNVADLSIDEARDAVTDRTRELADALADLGLSKQFGNGQYEQCAGDEVDLPRRDRTWTYQAHLAFDVTGQTPAALHTVDEVVARLKTTVADLGWENIDREPTTHLGEGGFQAYDEDMAVTVRTVSELNPPLPAGVLLRVAISVDAECVPMSDEEHARYQGEELYTPEPLDS